MTNKWNTTLYTGISSRLSGRVFDHKNKVVRGFTSTYNLNKLVYFEVFDTPEGAITREKQIKAGSRKKKIDLINTKNPDWKDLSDTL